MNDTYLTTARLLVEVVTESGRRLRIEALDLSCPPPAIVKQTERLASQIRAQLGIEHRVSVRMPDRAEVASCGHHKRHCGIRIILAGS